MQLSGVTLGSRLEYNERSSVVLVRDGNKKTKYVADLEAL